VSRNIFIDCGGNVGQSLKRFIASPLYKDDFELFTFEPVIGIEKYCGNIKNLTIFKKAVWIYDGEIDFCLDKAKKECRKLGGTIIKDKKTGHLDKENPVSVPCLNFSKWVLDNFSQEDFIILKMDIEGAEYKVLSKMVEDASINMVNKLYIEFHWNKIKIKKEDHDVVVRSISSIKTLELLPEMNVAL